MTWLSLAEAETENPHQNKRVEYSRPIHTVRQRLRQRLRQNCFSCEHFDFHATHSETKLFLMSQHFNILIKSNTTYYLSQSQVDWTGLQSQLNIGNLRRCDFTLAIAISLCERTLRRDDVDSQLKGKSCQEKSTKIGYDDYTRWWTDGPSFVVFDTSC